MGDTDFRPDDDADLDDFDAFWESQDKRKRRGVKIGGEWYELPKALPLQFDLEARKLAKSRKDEDVTKLVSILFGQDSYERFAAAGMDIDQFRVLLAWAPRRIMGHNVTLAQVAAEVAEQDATEGDADPS